MGKSERIGVKDLVVVTKGLLEGQGGGGDSSEAIEGYVSDLEKRESSVVERRAALRKISSAMLRRLIRRIEIDGDTGGLLPVDMVLRYMRFVLDLDEADRTVTDEVDPIEFLEKITGLPKEMIVSLYHTSSLEKFREVTNREPDVAGESDEDA